MDGWNYRIVKIKWYPAQYKSYTSYSIQEVYYEGDTPVATSTDEAGIGIILSDKIKDITQDLKRVIGAFTKPILYFDMKKNTFFEKNEERLDKQEIRAILETVLNNL